MTEMTSAATANTAANPPRSSPLRILCLQTTRGSGTAEQTWLTEHTLLKCTEQQQCYFWLLIPLDVNTITAYAQELRDFLDESEPTERRTFIKSFVKEIVVMPGSALLRYTIPISQSTRKAQVLVGGGSEEFRVGDAADACRQLYARAASCRHLLKQGQFRQLNHSSW